MIPGFSARRAQCLFLLILLIWAASPLALSLAKAADVDAKLEIPYQKFVLDNGLTLLVHEDHKAPIVAVNVWYHVGSKNEKPGKTGFAHLFEHLMFNGSEHFNDDYFQALEKVGATSMNGTTAEDRTNYFQNVPTSALDVALWMESDRMGHLLGVINQGRLDEQRGVVQNEKRQGENRPYALADELIAKNCFPAGHPYSWTVIGSMDDLSSASLADVHQWFKSYYGAANAILAIAGDIDPQTARRKVEQYFGDIPSGPPITRTKAWIAKRSGTQRQRAEDRVPQARIIKIWNVPEWGTTQACQLDLVSSVLTAGKTSRLYKRLVYDEQLATDVAAYVDQREIAGLFTIQATARPGVELEKVEKAIDEEMARFLKEGPTAQELERVKTLYRAGFVRGLERIGGFGGKSDILAEGQAYGGDPEYYKTALKRVREATAQDLRAAAQEWLADGVYVLEIHPFPQYKTAPSDVDRKKLPQAGAPPEAQFPAMQHATLSNGLKVILAERHSIPLVRLNLLLDAGYAADQFAKPGTATLALTMLAEGTKTRTSLQISDQLLSLGAEFGAGSNLDASSVSMSALKEKLDPALAIYADLILHPAFPPADFARRQKQMLAGIKQEKASPYQMANRVLTRFLYGEGHAYANPLSGSGTEESVARITRDDLIRFHQAWFKPNNATLIVVGDVTLPEMTAKLEKLFKEWPRGETPKKAIIPVKLPEKPAIYLMDKPDAQQSYIVACQIAPPKANPDEIAMETMNQLLGGTFTSRINMNLREGKHWSYGARSGFLDARGQRPFIVSAPVQSDKTKDAMVEIKKELNDIQGGRPVSSQEFEKTQVNKILRLPGSWETMGSIGDSISSIVTYGLPEDYYQTYPRKVRELKLEEVDRVARNVLHPQNVLWIVVGDRAKIEGPLRQLGYGEIRPINGDGKVIP